MMQTFGEFRAYLSTLRAHGTRMPALFVGHGSPMNGIQDNLYSQNWAALGQSLPEPTAILVISAHWLTRGTHITAMDFPRTIHDFGGFPEALYKVQYRAPGNPSLAREAAAAVKGATVDLDHEWGLDHGAWTVIRHMYPDAHIPVLQLSIDYSKDLAYHFALASELKYLREKGILIMGSGNMVHNLQMVKWDKLDEPEYGYEWAYAINAQMKQIIEKGDNETLIYYHRLGAEAKMAIPTPDHYIPLIYSLANKDQKDTLHFFNDKAVGGSITMTSLLMQ